MAKGEEENNTLLQEIRGGVGTAKMSLPTDALGKNSEAIEKTRTEMTKIIAELKQKMSEIDKITSELEEKRKELGESTPKKTEKILQEIKVPPLELLK